MNSKKGYSKKKLLMWALGYVLATALVTFGSMYLWESQLLTGIAILINLSVGIGMILKNREFVNSGDELQRKIQLESMGLTLGLAVVVGLAYSQLDTTNLIASDAEISMLVMFMGVTYILCTVINSRKYS
ncbi:hypothetical protein [Leeuwenhoekiella sp. LLG6367-2.1]|uniref:hypothetical protein n=1 Tax=Leeuwenhoekiella sp. LLG6367-2.1 TaxID=3160833 RepID=UPI00386D6D16|tara:strand:- start:403 stop:792 length:390 start_codon:yes stop_codon:yes gene_type:complete